jgi:hypothetical protein
VAVDRVDADVPQRLRDAAGGADRHHAPIHEPQRDRLRERRVAAHLPGLGDELEPALLRRRGDDEVGRCAAVRLPRRGRRVNGRLCDRPAGQCGARVVEHLVLHDELEALRHAAQDVAQ